MFRGKDVHGDGILVPYPPIPADFTAVPALILVHPRKKFNPSPQAPAYFLSTKGGNKSNHSGNTENTPQCSFIC